MLIPQHKNNLELQTRDCAALCEVLCEITGTQHIRSRTCNIMSYNITMKFDLVKIGNNHVEINYVFTPAHYWCRNKQNYPLPRFIVNALGYRILLCTPTSYPISNNYLRFVASGVYNNYIVFVAAFVTITILPCNRTQSPWWRTWYLRDRRDFISTQK